MGVRMIPVRSSNLSSVGYDNGTLYIHFHTGFTYWYANVPIEIYQTLMATPHKGEYFHSHIERKFEYGRC